MIELGNILRSAGLTVVEEQGWRSRGHAGSFSPLGGIWHHTGGLNALGVVIDGRSDLAGPLCNLYLDRAGVWHVIAAGVAWHAGDGHGQVLADIRAGIPPKGYAADLGLADDYGSGNHYFLGVEVEARGDHSPYPDAQVSSLVAGTAAICRALRWDENQWVHHREWTSRKVDMDLSDTLDLRALVREALSPPAAVQPSGATEEDDDMQHLVIDADGRPKALVGEGGGKDGHLARIFTPAEWQAYWRTMYDGGDITKPLDPRHTIKIEKRPVAEYDALTGFTPQNA